MKNISIHHEYEGGIEKSVPEDHRLASRGLIIVRHRQHKVSLVSKQKQICNERSTISTHWKFFLNKVNSAGTDEMQNYAAFYLGLHCLLKYPYRGFQYTILGNEIHTHVTVLVMAHICFWLSLSLIWHDSHFLPGWVHPSTASCFL